MLKNSSQIHRLEALDGLRGFAILLVFFNHIDSKFILSVFPPLLRPIINTLFASGTIGVTILFILSGFLMAYIYPRPQSAISFIQKRYARIFPLFITMSLVMTMLAIVPKADIFTRILIVCSFAVINHFVWKIIQKINSNKVNRILFLAFIVLQVLVGGWYLFGVLNKPAIVFNQQLPFIIRQITITLVNMTLTLPLGNYIPMLDGVYWSLASEILFYILYPILFVPIISKVGKQKKAFVLFFLASLFLFFFSINLLSRRILSLSMLFPTFFIYFITGITIGVLLKNKSKLLTKISSAFHYIASPFALIITIILVRITLASTVGVVNDWVRMLWSIPLTLFLIFAVSHRNSIHAFFTSKALVFLGTISYSVYLSHTLVVDGIHLLFRPVDITSNLIFVVISILSALLIGSILFYLLERPYFTHKTKLSDKPKEYTCSFSLVKLGVVGILSIAMFFAYQSNFNLFSIEHALDKKIIAYPTIPKEKNELSIGSYPEVRIKIRSPENNIGIFTSKLRYISHPEKNSLKENPQLVFQIKPSSDHDWFSTATYKPKEIGESNEHPFGFPLIKDALNKDFDIRIFLTGMNSAEDIIMHLDNQPFKLVSQLDKKELIKNPVRLINLLVNKVMIVLKNNQARIVFLGMLPFILFLMAF